MVGHNLNAAVGVGENMRSFEDALVAEHPRMAWRADTALTVVGLVRVAVVADDLVYNSIPLALYL